MFFTQATDLQGDKVHVKKERSFSVVVSEIQRTNRIRNIYKG